MALAKGIDRLLFPTATTQSEGSRQIKSNTRNPDTHRVYVGLDTHWVNGLIACLYEYVALVVVSPVSTCFASRSRLGDSRSKPLTGGKCLAPKIGHPQSPCVCMYMPAHLFPTLCYCATPLPCAVQTSLLYMMGQPSPPFTSATHVNYCSNGFREFIY